MVTASRMDAHGGLPPFVVVAAFVAVLATPFCAWGAETVLVDRAVLRIEVTDLGGAARFVFARELAFEARLEALQDTAGSRSRRLPYEQRHVRSAIERHVTETILAELPVEPPLRTDEIRRREIATHLTLQQEAGGRDNLLDAATQEGIELEDLTRLVRRRALASLYLDRMVTPMLDPTEYELREVQRTQPNPFRGQPFEDVAGALRRWYIAERLRTALAAFFRGARSRVRMSLIR